MTERAVPADVQGASHGAPAVAPRGLRALRLTETPLRVRALGAPERGVELVARDWPGAPWVAVPCLATGVPLLLWSVADARAVEGGGAIVFCAFGVLAARLSLANRRALRLRRTDTGEVEVSGTIGAGPFRTRADAMTFPADAHPDVVPFAVPEGAPDLPDRGGDLVLRAEGGRFLLARRAGPGWREDLESAAATIRDALG